MENYRDSHIQQGKGRSYHKTFSDDPYRRMVWQFEKGVLDQILEKFYGDAAIQHLDFACGTGRILSYLADRTKKAVGVDISPEMLRLARKYQNNAEIIETDLTRNDVLGERKFNLVTAFRFFPNAEIDLRREAMRTLSRHLSSDGYLVFNNHRNTESTRNRVARLVGRRAYRGMNIAEINELLVESRLEIVEIYPLCVFPASEKHKLLPVLLLRPIEKLLGKLRFLQNFGENMIFVCRPYAN